MIDFQQQLSLECKHTSVLDLLHSQVEIHHGESCKGISLAKLPQDLCSCENLSYQSNPEVIVEACINMGGFACWLYDQFPAASLENINAKRTVTDMGLDIDAAEANLSPLQNIENSTVTTSLIKCDLFDKNSLESNVSQFAQIIVVRSALIIDDSVHAYKTTASALGAFSGFTKPGEWFTVEDNCFNFSELQELSELPTSALTTVNKCLEANPNDERSLLSRMYTKVCHPYGFF
jgi:cephalosporin hydroxylase